MISGIVLGQFLVVLGLGWGPSLSPKGEHLQIAWFLKTSVSPSRNGRFGGSRVPNSVQNVRQMRSENDVALHSLLVDFWSVLGRILGPQIDQNSVKKSIEFRSRFWDAFLNLGGQTVIFAT